MGREELGCSDSEKLGWLCGDENRGTELRGECRGMAGHWLELRPAGVKPWCLGEDFGSSGGGTDADCAALGAVGCGHEGTGTGVVECLPSNVFGFGNSLVDLNGVGTGTCVVDCLLSDFIGLGFFST